MELHQEAQAEASPSFSPTSALSTVHGLYPLWEHTGVVANSGSFQVGLNHAHVAYGRVQLSTQPLLDIYGVLNVTGKVALISGQRFKLALVAGLYNVPTNAEGRMLGNLNPTGFVNPYASLLVAPIALAKSVALSERWALHWSSTLLLTHSEDAALSSISAGQALLLEAFASSRWRARMHAGVEGLRVQGQGHLALSFAYQGDPVFVSAGAGQRLTFAGERSTFIMFDAGLVFP